MFHLLRQVPDITMLFAIKNKKSCRKVVRHSQRIDSGSIGEEEYESLYAEHFPEYLKSESSGAPKIGRWIVIYLYFIFH